MPISSKTFALAALVAMAGPQQGPLASKDVIENVQWVRRPVGEAVTQYAPAFAALIGVTGRVTLRCQALFEGTPQNCAALSAQPEGMGFDEAARFVVATGIVRPRTVNGKPEAAVFNVSVVFPSTPIPTEPTETYQGREPTAKAISLARQVIEMYPAMAIEDPWRETIDDLPADRQSIVQGWLEELFPPDLEAESRRHVLALARVATEAELNAHLLAGVPIPEPTPEVFESALGGEDRKYLTALRTLRTRYCARWSCEIVEE